MTSSKSCKFSLCVLVCFSSEGCLLVPRTSKTPVAAWSWPTRVVESETCVGSRVHLVGVLSPSRRIFIGSHSHPPSLVRRFGPSPLTTYWSPFISIIVIAPLGENEWTTYGPSHLLFNLPFPNILNFEFKRRTLSPSLNSFGWSLLPYHHFISFLVDGCTLISFKPHLF
jgi:hypothetical protein